MIIAVDFDGILAEDSGKFPEIGAPIGCMVLFVKELIKDGHEVVLWTSRTDQALEDAIIWCKKHGLYFAAVNENTSSNIAMYSAQYPNGTRKVSADIYIDDHNPCFVFDKMAWGPSTAIKNTIRYARRVIKWKKGN